MATRINKTFITYIKDRVKEVVMCTNGKITTDAQKKKKDIQLSIADKLAQIRSGEAVLIDDVEIDNRGSYSSGLKALTVCFTFKLTEDQKRKIRHNECVDRACEEKQLEIELAGKRLIDRVVLGLIELKDMPDELEALSKMFERADKGD